MCRDALKHLHYDPLMDTTKKIAAAALLFSLLSLPRLVSQNIATPSILPKWEFGLRGGAGVSMIHLEGRKPYAVTTKLMAGRNMEYDNRPKPEIQSGIYLTRNLGHRWSVRSELTLVTNNQRNLQIALGVFPRYQVNSWLKLEAGVEAKTPLFTREKIEERYWFGAAIGSQGLEFNLRFSPTYERPILVGEKEWLGTFQAGATARLAKIGQLFRGN